MHAVVRTYSGTGASALFDLLEARRAEVEEVIGAIAGLDSYTMIRTADGGATVTVCADKAGTDASLAAARDWIVANAADLNVGPPTVSEGPVILRLG